MTSLSRSRIRRARSGSSSWSRACSSTIVSPDRLGHVARGTAPTRPAMRRSRTPACRRPARARGRSRTRPSCPSGSSTNAIRGLAEQHARAARSTGSPGSLVRQSWSSFWNSTAMLPPLAVRVDTSVPGPARQDPPVQSGRGDVGAGIARQLDDAAVARRPDGRRRRPRRAPVPRTLRQVERLAALAALPLVGLARVSAASRPRRRRHAHEDLDAVVARGGRTAGAGT